MKLSNMSLLKSSRISLPWSVLISFPEIARAILIPRGPAIALRVTREDTDMSAPQRELGARWLLLMLMTRQENYVAVIFGHDVS